MPENDKTEEIEVTEPEQKEVSFSEGKIVKDEEEKYHIKNLPIFEVGTFTDKNGTVVKFTEEKLKEISDKNNAFLKSGKETPLQFDHDPNTEVLGAGKTYGYAEKFETKDGKVYVDIELIKGKEDKFLSGEFRTTSPALTSNDRVKHIAVVGDQAIPVSNMRFAQIVKFSAPDGKEFYYEEEGGLMKNILKKLSEFFGNISEEDIMADKDKEMEAPKDETKDFSAYEKQINDLKKENEDIKKTNTELQFKERETEINTYINSKKTEGKLVEAQNEKVQKLMLSFSDEQKKLFEEFVDMNILIDFSEQDKIKEVIKKEEKKEEKKFSEAEMSAMKFN